MLMNALQPRTSGQSLWAVPKGRVRRQGRERAPFGRKAVSEPRGHRCRGGAAEGWGGAGGGDGAAPARSRRRVRRCPHPENGAPRWRGRGDPPGAEEAGRAGAAELARRREVRAVPTCWVRTGPALSGARGGNGAGLGGGRGGRRTPSSDPPLLPSILTSTAHLLRWGLMNSQDGEPFSAQQNNHGDKIIPRGSASFWQGPFSQL